MFDTGEWPTPNHCNCYVAIFFLTTLRAEVKIGLLQQTATWQKMFHSGGQTNVTTSKTKQFQSVKLDFTLCFYAPVHTCIMPSSMADIIHCTISPSVAKGLLC